MLASRSRTAILAAATVLLLAGCGGTDPTAGSAGGPEQTGPPAERPTGTAGPGAAPEEVPDTLSFRAPTVDGEELDAATLAGQPVAFWFWAAWCPRCAAAAEQVRQVQAEYAGRAHVVGVAGLGSGEAGMREFVDQHQLGDFPHLADDDGQVWRRFGVTTQEYFVLLDRSGQVVHEGGLSGQDLREQLDSLAG